MSFADDFDLDEPEEEALEATPTPPSDKAIEKAFETGRLRVVQDRNDFFLPHVVDFIRGRKWGNLRPEYQRRLRWDNKKKSRLIESFIMNVPIPPVFLYESGIGSFEVMDGQQRLNTIVEFMTGEFELEGLKIWHVLNGRSFPKLPPLVRKGLERAKISAITLMSDGLNQKDNGIDLRAQVFDRINTGGEPLNQQELRNSLHSGPFNKLIIALAGDRRFTDAWGIPPHEDNILGDDEPTEILKQNNLYKRMADCEIVLRYFAFRDSTHISGSVRSILDETMKRHRASSPEQILELRTRFEDILQLAIDVFGKWAFRLPSDGKPGPLSRPLYDAQMVALDRLYDRRDRIKEKKSEVVKTVAALAVPGAEKFDLIVGRANTAQAIKDRINLVEGAIAGAL